MARFKSFLLASACAAILSDLLFAQATLPPPSRSHGQVVTPAKDATADSPFAIDDSPKKPFQVIPAEAMSSADKDLLARWEPDLRRETSHLDLGYGHGSWNYSQLDCPTFPDHLFLRFSQVGSKSGHSKFSVSLPRDGKDRLYIIPILRGSYAPFVPAADSPITIAVFNRILAHEKRYGKPNWEGVAACYSALVGADPESNALLDGEFSEPNVDFSSTLVLSISSRHYIIHFVTVQPQLLVWHMTFDRDGRLLKTTAAPSRDIKVLREPDGEQHVKTRGVLPGLGAKQEPVPHSRNSN